MTYVYRRKSVIENADDQTVDALKNAVGKMQSAYDRQADITHQFKVSNMRLKTEVGRLQQTCRRYLVALDQINMKGLNRKCLRLAAIMDDYENGKTGTTKNKLKKFG